MSIICPLTHDIVLDLWQIDNITKGKGSRYSKNAGVLFSGIRPAGKMGVEQVWRRCSKLDVIPQTYQHQSILIISDSTWS
jgi:hypothetical protein